LGKRQVAGKGTAMSATFVTPQAHTVLLRPCEGFEELDACVQIQIDVWGYSDGEVIPRRVFVVSQKIGGQVIGAFDVSDGEPATYKNLIGFAMAMPGVQRSADSGLEPYLHSHMLAVRPEYRNAGIGQRLKLAQREDAISRGFHLMEWTFDPLEIKNSFLNIHRLGAIVCRYTPNFYGVSSSRLQGGLPTDRLHAEWWMQSERVKAILSGSPLPIPNIQQTILVPREIGEWKSSPASMDRALAVQTENRQQFQNAFARGLAVIGFRTDANGNGIFELGEWRKPNLPLNL
jgi:predicted GNAT superfamily acetyltransferase